MLLERGSRSRRLTGNESITMTTKLQYVLQIWPEREHVVVLQHCGVPDLGTAVARHISRKFLADLYHESTCLYPDEECA